jgi:pyrimidine operon attenuation protein/uracil phosphoribosyltransferase
MTERTLIYGQEDIKQALKHMSSEILTRHRDVPVLVGIRRGGVTISERLGELMTSFLGQRPASGIIDINLYRDDWTRARALPKVGRTELPFSLDNRRIILVDDVLYTGRTVRSALEALSEFGRSSRIELAVLVDRGHREMPIQADYVAFVIDTKADEMVEVTLTDDEQGDEVLLLKPSDFTN